MQTLPFESLFIGRHRRFSPPPHTHTLWPSLKDSITRLNELFKTGGLFPDPWLCKSHCCQPIKQVQGPHSWGEQTTEIERIEKTQNRTSWCYSESIHWKRSTQQQQNNPVSLTITRMFNANQTRVLFTATKWTILMQTSKLETRNRAWAMLIEEVV